MNRKLSRLGKPVNLATLRRVNQRRQRWEVVSTIFMVMIMMVAAGFRKANATTN
ncbi:hypothetical protein [Alteromonas sp. ASW11-130]|uniref:hypothetical protein n=1 Tax=Alteromonas sp. ASW11-130 TaxID=3015775 RepID=UPI0022425532|nr:hypothetical protein [Alteromonas sp. ASW11-130]MCW8093285.1 hypothetical protein [Alteromonas sp. ASW11-130]